MTCRAELLIDALANTIMASPEAGAERLDLAARGTQISGCSFHDISALISERYSKEDREFAESIVREANTSTVSREESSKNLRNAAAEINAQIGSDNEEVLSF